MGQYYKVIILAEKTDKKEFIRGSLEPYAFGSGSKLTEHAYINDNFASKHLIDHLFLPLMLDINQ